MSEHLKTIKQVKEYLDREDYSSLADYIQKREIEVIIEENKASEYIDKLVKELK